MKCETVNFDYSSLTAREMSSIFDSSENVIHLGYFLLGGTHIGYFVKSKLAVFLLQF